MSEPKKNTYLALLKQIAFDRNNHPIARKYAISTMASFGTEGKKAIDEFLSKSTDPKLNEFARRAFERFKAKSDGGIWEKESRA